MKFIELRVQAFNRLPHPYRVAFEPGLTLVEGENRDAAGAVVSNGSCKSLAVVESLLYGLYGRMARHGGKPVTDEACHRINGADVTGVIDLKPGYRVHVRRTRTIKGRPTFTITNPEGGPVPVSRDPTRRGEDVAALLGLDYPAFRAAVVMTRGDALASAGFGTQMGVLEGILRLDELNDAAGIEQKKAAEIHVGVRAAESEVGARRRVSEEAALFLSRLKATAVFDFAGRIEALKAELLQCAQAAAMAEQLLQVIDADRHATDRAHETYTATLAREGTARAAKRELDQQTFATACPTCNRPYKDAKEIEAQRKAAQKKSSDLDTHLVGLVQERANAQGQHERAKAKYQARRDEGFRLKNIIDSGPRIQAEVAQLEQQQAQQALQRKMAEEQASAADTALVEAEAILQATQRRYWRTAWWVREFGRDGLQAQIFSQALPVLNHAARGYSQRLMGGLHTVAFNPLRTSRSEDLIRINDGALTYADLSDGEKERASLAIAFSLRALARWRLPEPINLLILDEVVSSVDPVGTQVVLALLNEEAQAGIAVFVITHDPEQHKAFPSARVLRVVRENDEATVYAP